MPSDDGVDRQRWDAAHAVSATPTFSRIKRQTICAHLPEGIEPTTLWPAWPLEKVAAALDLTAGETMVDLGCGRGEVGLWIARHLEVDWIGVDPSPVGLSIAAEQVDAGVGARSAKLVEGHFLATGLGDASADAVLILDALHFSPDVPATLAEVTRVLRPGRRLLVVGPQQTDPRPALRDAGFTIERDEQTPGWLEEMDRFLTLARENAEALRAELGEPTATTLLSRDISQLKGMGHGLIAARRG